MTAIQFPEWCLLCASTAFDNSCGHFPGPMPRHTDQEQP